MTQYNTDQLNHLIRHRRSVFPKQFDTTQQVPDEVVRQALENATWAPSHGNIQPWKFIVYTREGLQQLATFQSEMYKELSGENFKPATYAGLQSNPLLASHVIALCLKRDPNKKFPEMEELSAVACAVQNMYLTLTAYGYGGYWTTGGVTYREQSKPFFGLEADDKLMGFFYLGVVATPSPDSKRQPLEEKIVWVDGSQSSDGGPQ